MRINLVISHSYVKEEAKFNGVARKIPPPKISELGVKCGFEIIIKKNFKVL